MFSLEERQKLLSKYSRRKEDEEQNMGVVKKITHSSCFHIGQSIASYFALFAMISALIVLAYPPHFGPLVSKATEKNFPAKNPLFDKLSAAADKSELKNTEYRLAFANGKSAVRVCTDLELKTFEEHTKLTREFRMWDNMKDKAIEQFISDGCDNTTTLAFNAACNDEKGAFYTKEDSGTSIPDVTSTTEFPSRGQCGNPGSQDGVFSNPDPGRGWLWKYMVQSEVTPKDFPPDYNVTNRTCMKKRANKILNVWTIIAFLIIQIQTSANISKGRTRVAAKMTKMALLSLVEALNRAKPMGIAIAVQMELYGNART